MMIVSENLSGFPVVAEASLGFARGQSSSTEHRYRLASVQAHAAPLKQYAEVAAGVVLGDGEAKRGHHGPRRC
jgi:hypothetical protein